MALLAMKISTRQISVQSNNVLNGLREGYRYVTAYMPIRMILTNLAVISLLSMPFTVLMPVFAAIILHGGAHTLGYLMAAVGVGALFGAIFMASRRSVLGLETWIPIACTLFGAGLISFSLSRTMWLSLALLEVAGFGTMVQMASCNTIIQTVVVESKRGRVMSFYTMAFLGTAPPGSLLSGALGDRLGTPNTVLLGGALCIPAAAHFASRRPLLRKHMTLRYEELGIMPSSSEMA